MVNYYTLREASNILGIKPGRLRYWKRIHLVRPTVRQGRSRYYNFQDLICLRTAQGLVLKGVPATHIRRSIESLKRKFPGFDDNLADKRIYVFGHRAIIAHQNRLIDTQSGQLFLKFDVEDLQQQIRSRVHELEREKTPQEWFQEGLRYDRNEKTYGRALQAYREALRLDPNFTDAYVRMGNVFYRQGKFLDAQRCYRLAVARDPYHARAQFNLGNVLDALHCTEDAVQCYERALEADPDFADVYFNLAVASEKLELWDKALRLWRHYLKLEAEGSHAEFARRRIELLQSMMSPG